MSGRMMRVTERIERTPLAWPMAALMAGAVAFLVYAVPSAVVAGMLHVPFPPLHRAATAAGLALVAGGLVWALFHRLDHPRPASGIGDASEDADAIDLFAPDPPALPATAPALQLRRADAHPDAPPRRPMFAASDLGAPMDDVDGGATPFGRPPLFTDPRDAAELERDAANDTLLLDAPWPDQPEPETAPEPEPVPPPEPAPIPIAPIPVAQATIGELMARLERGLVARGGDAAAGDRGAADEGLREALDELRRMTMGR